MNLKIELSLDDKQLKSILEVCKSITDQISNCLTASFDHSPDQSVQVITPEVDLPDLPQDSTLSEDKDMNDEPMILGKNGRAKIYNNNLIQKLLDQGWTIKEIAEKYNLSYQPFSMYVRKSTINYSRRNRKDSVQNTQSSNEEKKTVVTNTIPKKVAPVKHYGIPDDWKTNPLYKGYIKCSQCDKIFHPEPQSIYKDKRGRKVCSYTCARKAGTM